MTPEAEEVLRIYLQVLSSPFMRWMLWISIASVVIVCIIAWRRGLSIWWWFLYSVLLGPVALVHILIKSRPPNPPESPKGL